MKYLKVGIAYEGGDDGELIATIVKKILEPSGYTFNYFEPETPGTAIIDFVPSYTRRFVDAGVDIGIYCTDQDESSASRRLLIQDKIRTTDEPFLEKAAIGVPIPHIEAWLIQQDSIVKNLLGIDGAIQLPHAELSPKDRLTALYSESDTYLRSRNDLRVDIAQQLDVNFCSRQSNDFKLFADDVKRIIARLP